MDNNSGVYYSGIAPQAKKPFITKKRVIVAGVILAAGLVAIWIIPRLLNPVPKNVSQAFNLYSNYILYGEKSMEGLSGEYMRTNTYKIDELFEGSNKEGFYKEANGYFESFIGEYESWTIGGDKKAELDGTIGNHIELWDFAQKYASTIELTDELVLGKYLEGGELVTQEYVLSSYQVLAESDNGKIKQYGELKIEQFNALIMALNMYRDNGCFNEGDIDVACVDVLVNSNEIMQGSYGRFYKIKYTAEQVVNANRDDLLRGCWTVGTVLAEISGE